MKPTLIFLFSSVYSIVNAIPTVDGGPKVVVADTKAPRNEKPSCYLFIQTPIELGGKTQEADYPRLSFLMGARMPKDFFPRVPNRRGPEWSSRNFVHFRDWMASKEWPANEGKWYGYSYGFDKGDEGWIGGDISAYFKDKAYKNWNNYLADVRGYLGEGCGLVEENITELPRVAMNNKFTQLAEEGKPLRRNVEESTEHTLFEKRRAGGTGCRNPEDVRKNYADIPQPPKGAKLKAVDCLGD